MTAPTADMSLAFKTRQKLAGTANREDKDLRRVVLLCNTYDTFQRRMAEHFCASSALFAGLDLSSKEAQISCREVAVVDDDDDEDDDDDGWDADSDSDSDSDDEDPPPYEFHALPTDTAARDFAAEAIAKLSIIEVPVLEEDEDSAQDLDGQEVESLDNGLPTYTASATAPLKNIPPPPPLPRRSNLRGRPGMGPSRASYGHHTVSLSAEHAHGIMEVH